MSVHKILTFILLGLLALSCTEDKITPSFGIEKITDQIGDISLSYDVDEEVDGFGGELSDVGGNDVGSVLRRLATSFADIELRENGGVYVDIDTQEFDFPELKDIDFSYIKSVEFTTVEVELIETEEKDENQDETLPEEELTLDFVNNLEVFLIVDKISHSIQLKVFLVSQKLYSLFHIFFQITYSEFSQTQITSFKS